MANDVKIIISAVDKASATLKKVSGELDKTGKSGASGFKALAGSAAAAWGAVAAGVGVAVTVGSALKKIADNFMNYAFEVQDFGRIIGASAEDASKLIQVADDVRLSTESMTTAMRSAITKGFSPTVEGLGDMSDAYLRLAPGIERSRFLIETFGRSGLEMAKLMELGSRKIQEMGDSIEGTGLLMTEEGIEKAKEYYKQLDTLSDQWEGMKQRAGALVLPIFINVVGDLNEFIDLGNKSKVVQQELSKAYQEGKISQEELAKAAVLAMGSTEDLARAEIILGKVSKEKIATYAEIRSRTIALVEAQYKLTSETGEVGDAFLAASGSALVMSNSLQQAHNAMTAIGNAAARMQADKLKTQFEIDAGVNFHFPDITSELAAWLKKDKWTAAGGEFVMQAYLDLQPRMLTSGADVREKLAKEIGALELAIKIEVGELSKDEARRQFMDAFGVKYGEAAAAIDVAAKIDTSSVDTIKEGLKNDDFLAPLVPKVDDTALAAARAAMAQPVNVPLVPVMVSGGGAGAIDKWNAYQEIKQNKDLNNNGKIGLASGGPVNPNQTYLVGERGPELFVSSKAGKIIPNGDFGGGAYIDVGGIYIQGGGQSPQAIAQAVIAQLNRSMRAARQSGLGYVGA